MNEDFKAAAHGYACRCPQCLDPLTRLILRGERDAGLVTGAVTGVPEPPDLRQAYYQGTPCGRHRIPAPDCRDCAALSSLGMTPDPWSEFRAVMSEPLGLSITELDRLAPYPDQPPGACEGCKTGPPLPGTALCGYCTSLNEANPAALGMYHEGHADHPCGTCPRNVPPRRQREREAFALIWLALILGVLSVTVWPFLALGSWACLILSACYLPWRRK